MPTARRLPVGLGIAVIEGLADDVQISETAAGHEHQDELAVGRSSPVTQRAASSTVAQLAASVTARAPLRHKTVATP